MRAGRCCITTVTDAAYLPGTLVLLSSFLRHNSWFSGDIVIIHDGLPDAARQSLDHFPNLVLLPVGAELKARLAVIAKTDPAFARKLPILFGLETFKLHGYERVLKLDSDLLCTGNAIRLLDHDDGLLCCPDQAYFKGQMRDRETYLAQPASVDAMTDRILPMCFNAGVLAFAPHRLGTYVYDALLARVRPETWAAVQSGHTDSIVLNEYFRDRWTQLDDKYNHLISAQTARYTRDRAPIKNAVFIHFLGRPKPWQPGARSAAVCKEQHIALDLWNDAWVYATANRSTG